MVVFETTVGLLVNICANSSGRAFSRGPAVMHICASYASQRRLATSANPSFAHRRSVAPAPGLSPINSRLSAISALAK